MSGSSIGQIFKISTFGESHGKGIGVVIEGCPSGLEIDESFINSELARRRPGQSKITTQRKEVDKGTIYAGVFEGTSTGAPIMIFIENQDQRSKDYNHLKTTFRPSHSDFVYQEKYGIRDYKGGGRSSARETAARVAAGAIAKIILNQYKIVIRAFVSSVGLCSLSAEDKIDVTLIEQNIMRCPNRTKAKEMIEYLEKIKQQGNTTGGIIHCEILNTPIGLGAPVFDRLNADLAKAMMSINAAKGFQIGSGFEGTKMLGSAHNDLFYVENEKVKTKTNFSGGIQGGISNGMPIYFDVAFKPVSTIMQTQESINQKKESIDLIAKGRHDPCVVPRAVPIVEAMAALTIVDHLLRQRTTKNRPVL